MHDAGRVLARCELDDEQRDRESDAGKGDGGTGDRAQEDSGAFHGRREPQRQVCGRVEVPIQGEGDEREGDGPDHRQHGNEEQARPDPLPQRAPSKAHRSSLAVSGLANGIGARGAAG